MKELSDSLAVTPAALNRSSCNHWAITMTPEAIAAVKKCTDAHVKEIKEALPIVCGEYVCIGVSKTNRTDDTEKCVWRKVVTDADPDVFIYWSCTHGGWVFSTKLQLHEPDSAWSSVLAWAGEDTDDPEMANVLPSFATVAIPPHSKETAAAICGSQLIQADPYGQWACHQLELYKTAAASPSESADASAASASPEDPDEAENYGHPAYNGPVKYGWSERAAKLAALYELWDCAGVSQVVSHYKSRYPMFGRALHRFVKYGVPQEL